MPLNSNPGSSFTPFSFCRLCDLRVGAVGGQELCKQVLQVRITSNVRTIT